MLFSQRSLRGVLAVSLATLACALAACATKPQQPALTQDQISAILSSPDRTGPDRINDLRRKPAQMLAFIGVRPGMVALDVSAAGGYTTELLARASGPTGMVYGEMPQRDPNRAMPMPAAPEGASNPAATPMPAPAPAAMPAAPAAPRPTSAASLAERSSRLKTANVAAAPIVAVPQPFEDPAPAAVASGGLDLVTLMFNYHDMGFMGVDRAQMNRAIFKALKRGGVFVIADHAGRPGTGISESGTLHRIEETFLRSEVESAGFRLVAEGSFLRNPNDPRDKNTPEPPQPKDEFVLKFVKP
jgi:predicted methyltransferase